MTLVFNRQSLLDALTMGSHFCTDNKAIPLLSNVKITLKKGLLVVSSFNGESAIKYAMKIADDVNEFEACINAKDIISIIQNIKEDEVTLVLDSNKCTINHSRGKLEVSNVDASDMLIPTMENTDDVIELNNEIICNIFKEGIDFVNADELRPTTNGIYLSYKNGVLDAASTNSHILYANSQVIDANSQECNYEAIVSKNCINAIIKATSKEGKCKIKFGNTNIEFRVSNISIICRKIVGKFPNYKAVIPNDFVGTITLSRNELINSIKRLNLISDISKSVKMKYDNGTLNLDAINIGMAKAGNEHIECQGNIDFPLGINGNNLLICLNAITKEEICLNFKSDKSPLTIKEDNKTILCMPVNLNN